MGQREVTKIPPEQLRAVTFAVALLATLGANYALDRFRFWRAGIP